MILLLVSILEDLFRHVIWNWKKYFTQTPYTQYWPLNKQQNKNEKFSAYNLHTRFKHSIVILVCIIRKQSSKKNTKLHYKEQRITQR